MSPTSIVIAAFGRDDSAFTWGAVATVQTTIWFPFREPQERRGAGYGLSSG